MAYVVKLNNIKILALIVSYNGQETICSALDSCLTDERLPEISTLIIDNASTDNTIAAVKSLEFKQLEIISMPSNIGIATAYNIGLKKAQELKAQWLFLLDQDSTCLHCCLNHLLEEIDILEQQGKRIGAISACVHSWYFPNYIHFPYYWTGKSLITNQKIQNSATKTIAIHSSLNSGTLYNVKALSEIGGFKDDYLIDFIDHECHLRLHQAHWEMWWHKHAIMYHRLGNIQKIINNNLWIEYEPYYYYYMTLNMLEGLRSLESKTTTANFIKREILKQIKYLWKYGKHPVKSNYFIIKAILHGLLGKSG